MTFGRQEQKLHDELYDQENWSEMRTLLRSVLKEEPDCHWLLTRISMTYYEEYEYAMALEFAKKALQLEPRCPLALWDCAGALDMLDRQQEAIRIWQAILNVGEDELAHGDCAEGVGRARSLMNDCRYRIGKAHGDLRETGLAIHWMRSHLANRRAGQECIYSKREVERELRELERESSSAN